MLRDDDLVERALELLTRSLDPIRKGLPEFGVGIVFFLPSASAAASFITENGSNRNGAAI